MKKPSLEIKEISIPVAKSSSMPKLLFPATSYIMDDVYAEDAELISYEYLNQKEKVGSSVFWTEIKFSEKIIIIDKYFCSQEIQRLNKVFQKLKEQKKLFNFNFLKLYMTEDCIMKAQNNINELQRILQEKIHIYKMEDNTPIHDRFAILDNVLYHFGGTVGGFQNGLTAFSYGWEDKNIEIFLNKMISENYIYKGGIGD